MPKRWIPVNLDSAFFQYGFISRREEMVDKLVALAEHHIPGLRQHTKTRLILTPEDFRLRTHLKHHSFGGVPPIIGNKPPAHKTPIRGLWFIGAQSESGGGIVNVMTGAQKTVRQISKLKSQSD